ncbi:Aquaporin SIP2-1 like [Actinidia chinensis var. chinensis]|uniref:Aquaporin SIP2-1 like n=1 Tax=Actinidia chinensis var. chinensis TaxID=1590841 RepID=A0A2R6Q2W5_ACTCC|nr:Aquaporin SIP2-1 like [Actinidia chinensis var. chinensis]
MAAGGMQLLVSDFVMSFMWVWSSVINKLFVYSFLGLRPHEATTEAIKCSLSILNMFFFAYLGKVTKGGAYNPLTILSGAISGDFSKFLFTFGARIPAQVVGSITGVRLIIESFPEIGHGPSLNVDIHRGALTEGLLTFAIVTISLILSRSMPGSFYTKTWISSLSKLSLHILGSDLTGGCMNPASVMGWAFARGDHLTKEHMVVYWLAPIQGTLLAVWTFKLLARPTKEEKANTNSKKSD